LRSLELGGDLDEGLSECREAVQLLGKSPQSGNDESVFGKLKAEICPSSIPKAPLLSDTMLGVSVEHLRTIFMDKVRAAGLTEKSTIHDIENLRKEPGLIRQMGSAVTSSVDGRIGAAYVHCLVGEDHVGRADSMLSYSWR
jgi:hypothetical protein